MIKKKFPQISQIIADVIQSASICVPDNYRDCGKIKGFTSVNTLFNQEIHFQLKLIINGFIAKVFNK